MHSFYIRSENLIYADDGDKTYYHFNAHGDVVVLTNSNGSKTKSYSYNAFGVEYNEATLDNNPFRYCGEYYDKETTTIYLRARYYNAAQGRFTQEDTHWNVSNMIYGDDPDNTVPDQSAIIQSGNLYVYCSNNPIIYIDPTGEFNWGLLGKIALTTAVVAACLTGVGAIAAIGATVAATSVTAAVTTAVVTAGISTTLSAIDGAICAESSGGEWYDGAMAGAMGGSVGALVSNITNPEPNSDTALRMNTLGRACSSIVYDVSYEFFDTGKVEPVNLGLYSADVAMDIAYSPIYYDITGGGYSGAIWNGLLDGGIDVIQTNVFFNK